MFETITNVFRSARKMEKTAETLSDRYHADITVVVPPTATEEPPVLEETSLTSIVATSSTDSLEAWEARKAAREREIAEAKALREKLLPIEREQISVPANFSDPAPILEIAGLKLPRIDKEFVCSSVKRFENGDILPAFAIYDVNKSSVCSVDYDDGKLGGVYGCRPRTQLENAEIRASTARYAGSSPEFRFATLHGLLKVFLRHTFKGTLPSDVRGRIAAVMTENPTTEIPFKDQFGNVHAIESRQRFQILLVEEAYAWNVEVVRKNPDPLIVVNDTNTSTWYLLDKFDVTPLEDWIAKEAQA